MPRLGGGGTGLDAEVVPLGLDPHRLVEGQREIGVGRVGAQRGAQVDLLGAAENAVMALPGARSP